MVVLQNNEKGVKICAWCDDKKELDKKYPNASHGSCGKCEGWKRDGWED